MRTRLAILPIVLALALADVAMAAPDPPLTPAVVPAQPNIVIVNLDDHGMTDGTLWSRLPAINEFFIERGVSFVNYWNSFPLCCPGRATQLTGQRARHHGVIRNDALLFDDSVTLATELQNVGYHTFISGKYLNGTPLLADKSPPGWDRAAIFGGAYYRYTSYVDDVPEYHDSSDADYSTDVFAEHSLAFVRDAPADKPVFAYLNPYAVHEGKDQDGLNVGREPAPAPRHVGDARCSDAPPFAPANFNEANVSDKPWYVRKIPPLTETGFPMVRVCESLLSVDEWLAAFVDELSTQGRLDNTVLVLTSDNARAWGSNRWTEKIAPYSAQTPLVINWPNAMADDHTVNTNLLSNVDLAPTLCEIAGCEMGPFANGYGVDGQSFVGLLAPEYFNSVPVRDAIILEQLWPKAVVPLWRGLITSPDFDRGQWFLIEYYQIGDRELYNLNGAPCFNWSVGEPGDPCMMKNLGRGRKFKRLRTRLHAMLVAQW